ncbi:uncharacterized protein LOC129727094 isoform X2 [Wyeomyia smithii]|uniref:uncharacterized protein LOC129727094 isoform X2 n=1 Tax=Wyeomyia smithii TaxID=174621 RepID=UPI00246820E4|nr:uncharacterized protein LOC129727094 isoform X2 [Wyeomyia smithii]
MVAWRSRIFSTIQSTKILRRELAGKNAFINNYNSTTSLYQRRTNKLLVTFRNENMLYDQPPQSSYRKCLLPKQSNSQHCDLQAEQMVEPAFFDIYLCDDCDAELYSYDAYVEHEKVCLTPKMDQQESDDDDVIYCGSEMLPAPILPDIRNSASNVQSMSSFLLNFNLIRKINSLSMQSTHGSNYSFNHHKINVMDSSSEKLRHLPRRTRNVVTLTKCTSIPLSSPCGQFLLKSIKTVMSSDYRRERLERLERFCFAPPLVKDGTVVINRPKWMHRSKINQNVTISYKKNPDEPYNAHYFKFPRRQFSVQCKKKNFLFYNKLLLDKCKPCAIKLKKLSAQEIEDRNIDIRLKILDITKTEMSCVEHKGKKTDVKHVVVDCIDLCSSGDEEIELNYGDSANRNSLNIGSIRQFTMNISTQVTPTIDVYSNSLPCFRHDFDKPNDCQVIQPLTPTLHLFSSVCSDTKGDSTLISNISHVIDIESADSTVEMSDHFLTNLENLTDVKENRVNDWLIDTAITSGRSIQDSQTHSQFPSNIISRGSSTLVKTSSQNNGSESLPPLNKLENTELPGPENSIRQRTVTRIDI